MELAEYERMDAVEARLWWYRALHARLVGALVGVRGAVLDAGCGTGGFLQVLGRERPDLGRVGCERDYAAAVMAGAKGAVVTVGSVHGLPFGAGVFDAVVSADVLCHAGVEPVPALLEMRRVLRPGGLLVVNMPAFMWLFSEHDRRVDNVRRVSAGQLRRLLEEAGFARPRVRYWNGFLLPLMILRRLVMARGVGAESDVKAVPGVLNSLFMGLLVMERGVRLPAGGSVMAVATCR